MLEHFGKPPKIAPRIRVYPYDPNICGFTQTERGLSLKMDSVKTITEIRQKIFAASTLPCWSQEGLSETELSLRSMKSNQLKENEQSSVCTAAGGVRGGSPQPSKLACSDRSETPQTPMIRSASEIRAIEQGREGKQVSTLNPTIWPERYSFSSNHQDKVTGERKDPEGFGLVAATTSEAIHDGENHKTKRLERSVKQSSIKRKNRREESRAWREAATPASCGAAGVGNHI
ncbi:hypothetical protein YC2023_093524 [Brassica napus]